MSGRWVISVNLTDVVLIVKPFVNLKLGGTAFAFIASGSDNRPTYGQFFIVILPRTVNVYPFRLRPDDIALASASNQEFLPAAQVLLLDKFPRVCLIVVVLD